MPNGRAARVRFRVVNSSSEDPAHPAAELNEQRPETRGWHSQANCRFPQEIVIQFEQPVSLTQIQVLSHEFLIATRIEIFVVDPTSGQQEWSRLGHFSLSSNEKSSYQARELKSVQLKSNCSSMMLRLLDAHRNPHNLHNQVAIVLLSVFGETASTPLPPVPAYTPVNANPFGALPPAAAGLQTLAEDLGVDEETARRIRDLTFKKESAVAAEDYDTAKECKFEISQLQQLAAQIGELERRKRQAVADEDYDTAKQLKAQINQLRPGTREPTPLPPTIVPPRMQTPAPAQPTPSPLPASPPHNHSVPYETYEEAGELPPSPTRAMFPPALELEPELRYEPEPLYEPDPEESPIRPIVPEVDNWPTVDPSSRPGSRQLNVGLNSSRSHDGDQGVNMAETAPEKAPELPEPEALSSNDAQKAENVVPVFGEMVARHLFSKDRPLREKGLEMVQQHLETADTDVDDTVQALSAVLVHALQDKTAPVVMQAFPVLNKCVQLSHSAKAPGAALKPVAQLLVDRTAESNKRIALEAQESLVEMGNVPGLRSVVSDIVTKPIAKKTPAHLAARLQLLNEVVPVLQVGDMQGELELDKVMTLVLEGFLSPNARCRDASLKLTVQLAQELGDNEQVLSYLSDQLKPQQLESLENSLPDNQVNVVSTPREQREQFPANSPPVNIINSPRNEAERVMMNKSLGGSLKRHSHLVVGSSKQNSPASHPPEEDTVLSPGLESLAEDDFPSDMCQFCGLQDANFTEDTLDFHFWQDCPMLCGCDECGQVIEIMCLGDHLLGECDARDTFSECGICTEAIKNTEMAKHTGDGCPPAVHGLNRCPLCHQNFGGGEEGWKDHILVTGCPANPRTNKPQ